MENKVEVLYNTIQERIKKWDEYVDLFGEEHYLTKMIFNSLDGLQEAFKIISGHTYTEHLIRECEELLSA